MPLFDPQDLDYRRTLFDLDMEDVIFSDRTSRQLRVEQTGYGQLSFLFLDRLKLLIPILVSEISVNAFRI